MLNATNVIVSVSSDIFHDDTSPSFSEFLNIRLGCTKSIIAINFHLYETIIIYKKHLRCANGIVRIFYQQKFEKK